MVADAVLVEPVSNENSLLTGKLTGNFVKSVIFSARALSIMYHIQIVRVKIPYVA